MGNKCLLEGCNAWALKDDIHCFRHSENPEVIKARKKASSKGGKKSRKYPVVRERIPDVFFELKTLKDLGTFMEMLINGGLKNELELEKVSKLAYCCNILRSILETSEIEQRLEKLEEVLDYAKH